MTDNTQIDPETDQFHIWISLTQISYFFQEFQSLQMYLKFHPNIYSEVRPRLINNASTVLPSLQVHEKDVQKFAPLTTSITREQLAIFFYHIAQPRYIYPPLKCSFHTGLCKLISSAFYLTTVDLATKSFVNNKISQAWLDFFFPFLFLLCFLGFFFFLPFFLICFVFKGVACYDYFIFESLCFIPLLYIMCSLLLLASRAWTVTNQIGW